MPLKAKINTADIVRMTTMMPVQPDSITQFYSCIEPIFFKTSFNSQKNPFVIMTNILKNKKKKFISFLKDRINIESKFIIICAKKK